MKILFLTNSKKSFIDRVELCIESSHSKNSILLKPWKIFNFLKVLMYAPQSEIIWCEFASYHALYGVIIGRLFNKKTIVHVHRFEVNDSTFFQPLIIWTIKNANLILCPSEYIAKRIKTISGVEAKILYNSAPEPIDFDYILSVGALITRKGHDKLILGFKEKYLLSDMKLIILGKGPEKKNLEKLIVNLNLKDRVYIITEYIPDIILDLLFKNCNTFALLSEDEGMSVSIIEAGMHDKALWVTEIEPNQEYFSTDKEKFRLSYMQESIDDILNSMQS